MKNKQIVMWSVILLVLSFFIDNQIVNFFKLVQVEPFVSLFKYISFFGSMIPLVIFLSIYFYKTDKKKLKSVWATLLLVYIISFAIKNIIARDRPINDFSFIVDFSKFSFPSTHAAAVFSMIPFFDKESRRYWYWFAFLVVLSRIFVLAHYLSDVVAGALLGFGIVSLVLYWENKQ